MPTTMIDALIHLGLPGCMLAFFIWYLVKKDNDHAEERKELSAQNQSNTQRFIAVVEKNTDALIKMEVRVENAECKFGAGR